MTIEPKTIKLDEYEQEIEDNFEKSNALPTDEKDRAIEMLQAAAKNYLIKDKRITVRVYSSDLERIKMLAAEEGLPYQTYITSMLHKLSTGRLKDTRS